MPGPASGTPEQLLLIRHASTGADGITTVFGDVVVAIDPVAVKA